jgi:hypothetical protein
MPTEIGIPDKNLPEPWSCDWRGWRLLPFWRREPGGIEYRLLDRFDIGKYNTGLKPVMFRSTRSTSGSTVFRAYGERGTTFYLYDEPSDDVYRFEHDFPLKNGSAEEFAETANWNKMTYLGSLGGPPFELGALRRPASTEVDKCIRLRDLENSEVRLQSWCPNTSNWSIYSAAHPVEIRTPDPTGSVRTTSCYNCRRWASVFLHSGYKTP